MKEVKALNETILEMNGITKKFPGVLALDNSCLCLKRGEVHGLIGENGAGKSTLMKILCGIYQMDSGEIIFEGKKVNFTNVRESLEGGICMIHQELNLIPHLTVAQNIFITRENEERKGFLVKDRIINEKAQKYLDELNIKVSTNTKVSKLSVGHQQMVEIAKAISFHSRILIMDEPTAALTNDEIEDLFRVIGDLKKQGITIVYISHRMDELKKICDTVTVMRDGRTIDTNKTKDITIDEIIAKMVGREIENQNIKKKRILSDEYILKVKNLCKKNKFKDITFDLRKGEILGFSGLMGAGRTEVARAIFGADTYDSGEIQINKKLVQIRKTSDAVKHGIGYLSEDRKALGILAGLPITDNMIISSYNRFNRNGIVNQKACEKATVEYIKKLRIKTPGINQKIKFLSGGNQQKVIIAKWLLKDSDILIFDEPTRGIDIGAKNEIYDLLRQLAEEGKSIIMISSEMTEILNLSDRIVVMCEGMMTAILDGYTATQEEIMKYATMRK